ncbi:MAG: exopolysaccharide Pel transporter PelG [SAR324 cluster bacterium]|nr:exopolysaccharide Pel transporter PelG [SAR324 cluster bacterium]MBF0352876.1 exopolysaccharide Pel transporter PelG [SAR324 cluster bacterium]
MAGIGFDLKKLLNEDSAQSKVSAFFYTALVTSGPWLFAVISLSVISSFGKILTSEKVMIEFMGVAVYAFAFSMIFTSGSQWVITRLVSDCLYGGEVEKIPGIFSATMLLTLLLCLIPGIPAVYLLHLPLYSSMLCLALFVLCGQMWMTMLFISALKEYMRIVWAFLIGFLVAIPLSLHIGGILGRDGFLTGLCLGISIIVFMLVLSILVEFNSSLKPDWSILKAHSRYKILFFASLVMILGLWIDKLIFWFHEGFNTLGYLKVFPIYDGSMFIAYLTVLPVMAFFVMIIETDFYDGYRRFYYLIDRKVPYMVLKHARNDMVLNLLNNGKRALIFQLALTSGLIFLSPWLVPVFHFSWEQWPVMRIGLVAAILHMMFSLLNIVLAYFDCRKELLWTGLVYLIVNVLGTFWTLDNPWLYGYGYLMAGLAGSLTSFGLVMFRIKYLMYYTFVQ